jgi:hypothetical protein
MSANAVASLRQTLLADPSRLDSRAAAIRILTARHKCAPDQAKARLERAQHCHAINELFQKALPADYERELKKVHGSKIEVAGRFFSCLGFPVYEDILAERMEEGNPLEWSIPIVGSAFHACPDCCDFKDLELAFQIAFVTARSIESPFGVNDAGLQEREDEYWKILSKRYHLDHRLKPTGAVDMPTLFGLYGEQRTPLRFLTQVDQVISYSTGSIFFDFDENEMGDPNIHWSPQNIGFLREDHALAVRIESEIKRLEKWLAASPTKRISQALRLYHKARKLTNAKRKQRVSVPLADSEGLALVRILRRANPLTDQEW